MMKYHILLALVVLRINNVFGNFAMSDEKETKRVFTITEIIKSNLKSNGWNNIFCVGFFPDPFYSEINNLNLTLVTLDVNKEDYDLDNVVPYHSNVIILSYENFEDLETTILNVIHSSYWHPLANIILYCHGLPEKDELAKIFIILWYHKAANAIIVTYDDEAEYLKAFYYSPYVDEQSKLPNKYGCWTGKKSGTVINNDYRNNFICEKGCHNITLTSKIRAYYLGTCIGFDFHKIYYENRHKISTLSFFKDQTRNLSGFVLRAFAYETLPFLRVDDHKNGSFTLHNRDGMIWRTMAELMNFKIDLSAVKDVIKKPFKFDFNVQYVFDFAKRYADLLLVPVYQFDVVVVDVDYTVPFIDSGVCIVSHRAEYQTVLFDEKLLASNYEIIIRFVACFVLMWFTFFAYNVIEKGRFTFDQLGIDLMNTCRSTLSISLYRPPRKRSFRIFIAVSTWSFFIINFATQAAIISFFSSYKRGKEVDTFEDVIEKGYNLEGMASPDILLPDDEERFEKINNKIIAVDSMFMCLDQMRNNSHRFCLVDCAVARYFARNKLDDRGEQYLHIATQDRMHSHYLNMFFQRHSPMTDNYNKLLQRLIEGGIIKKWEEYRFNDMKDPTPIKALAMSDLSSIFHAFCVLLSICCFIFLIEIAIGNILRIVTCINKYNRRRVERKKIKYLRKLGKIHFQNSSSQT